MSKTFRRYEPGQLLLLPVSLQEWLPPDHLARFIVDIISQLELSAIYQQYSEEGAPPYAPELLLRYCQKILGVTRVVGRQKAAFEIFAGIKDGRGPHPLLP